MGFCGLVGEDWEIRVCSGWGVEIESEHEEQRERGRYLPQPRFERSSLHLFSLGTWGKPPKPPRFETLPPNL